MWRIIVTAAVVGLCGLIGGSYLGPTFLCIDDCTAAPLNGIFISGPAGLLLGASLGAAAWLRRWRTAVFATVAGIAAIGASLAGTALSWPEARLQTQWIEGEIAVCSSPSALRDEALSRWRGHITPRAGWEGDLDRLLARSDGVVLTVNVRKRQDFYRRREPWRYGRIDRTEWRDEPKTAQFFARFAGRDCTAYRLGERRRFVQEWEPSAVSPPDTLPAFLGLCVIRIIH